MLPNDTEANATLDDRFSGRGSSLWLAQSTTVPTQDEDGEWSITEPVGAYYARVEIVPADWPPAADRVVTLSVPIPQPTAGSAKEVIVAWALCASGVEGTTDVRYAGRPAGSMTLEPGVVSPSVTVQVVYPRSTT